MCSLPRAALAGSSRFHLGENGILYHQGMQVATGRRKGFTPTPTQNSGNDVRPAAVTSTSAANSCKRHQENRAKPAERCDWWSFWPRSVLGRNATASRQRPPGYVRASLEKADPAPRSAGIARHFSPCAFWNFQSTRSSGLLSRFHLEQKNAFS